ncbi:MAG TPA: YkgJ family cysteine cluster protein [Thermomicrobiales bacterium]|nr:YkgJ family cysteine cluster protein [Thermomicrobiales bacterium]
MVTNESYIKLRNEALEMNEAGQEYCLCRGIEGGCCKPNLKMLPEDQQVIFEAYQRGEIAPETIRRAVERARGGERRFCPFLGDDYRCTIYEHRPVVCIQHGNGGLPKRKDVALKAMRSPGNKTIRVSEIEQFSCDACAKHVTGKERLPLAIVGKSVAILVTIQEGEKHYGTPRMNDFLINTFGDLDTTPAAAAPPDQDATTSS